jgi:hypothetical protein
MTYQVKKLVSKFAFQVHNLRRYVAVGGVPGGRDGGGEPVVGLCTLNSFDP